MKKICIAHESKTTDKARLLAEYLTKRDRRRRAFSEREIIFLCKDPFPIADAMLPFLANLSSKFDAAFVVIDRSNQSSIWLSKELKVQHNIGNCTNVYPALLTERNISDWWLEQDSHFVNIDSASHHSIDAFLNEV